MPSPCRAARPERGSTSPAWPARDRDRDPRADDRALARRELDALARGEIEPRVAVVGLRRERRRRRAAARPGASITRSLPRDAGSARRPRRGSGANRRTSRCGSRARISTPSRCPSARRSARRARTARRARAPRRTGTSSRTSSNRSAKRSAMRAPSSSRPSPVTAEIWSASGKRFASRRRASGSSRSILFSDELERDLAAPRSRASTVSTACDLLGQPSLGQRARRRRAGRDPRRASPRASTRSPRRAGSAGGG